MRSKPFCVLCGMLLVVAIAGSTAAVADTYGQDIVPTSTFHHGELTYYGHDRIPQTRVHGSGLQLGYGIDSVPGTVSTRLEDPHHVLLLETIQHLTGAVEVTPAPATSVRSYRRWFRR